MVRIGNCQKCGCDMEIDTASNDETCNNCKDKINPIYLNNSKPIKYKW